MSGNKTLPKYCFRGTLIEVILEAMKYIHIGNVSELCMPPNHTLRYIYDPNSVRMFSLCGGDYGLMRRV